MAKIKPKEDPFEDRCGFLGPEMMALIRKQHSEVGLYINDTYIDMHNLDDYARGMINSIFTENIPLHIVKTEIFYSHYDGKLKLKLHLLDERNI